MVIVGKVKEIIAEKLAVPLEDLDESKRLVEDLGADSLDLTELVMSIEEEFGVEIPDEDAMSIHTVGDAINHVKSLLP
jgi:acyl carrier protein